jgi:hypothetical protein
VPNLPEPGVGNDPPGPESVDSFIWRLFASRQIKGAGAGGLPLSLFDHTLFPDISPTSRFDTFGDVAFSAGVDGLYGCLSVVVVSRKGVWTSHFWEPSWRRALDTASPAPNQQQFDTDFEDLVINPLSNSRRRFTALNDPIVGNAFAAEHNPQVLIFGPTRSSRPNYPAVFSAVLAEVKRILPGIERGSQHMVRYKPLPREEALEGNARGKIVTNYDPRNKVKVDGAEVLIHAFQTWAETSVVMEDQWGQVCNDNAGGVQKRQADGACSLPSRTTSKSLDSTTVMATTTTNSVVNCAEALIGAALCSLQSKHCPVPESCKTTASATSTTTMIDCAEAATAAAVCALAGTACPVPESCLITFTSTQTQAPPPPPAPTRLVEIGNLVTEAFAPDQTWLVYNVGTTLNYDGCQSPSAVMQSSHPPDAGKYPSRLASFSLDGLSNCVYQSEDSETVGSIVCDGGVTLNCKPSPATQGCSHTALGMTAVTYHQLIACFY